MPCTCLLFILTACVVTATALSNDQPKENEITDTEQKLKYLLKKLKFLEETSMTLVMNINSLERKNEAVLKKIAEIEKNQMDNPKPDPEEPIQETCGNKSEVCPDKFVNVAGQCYYFSPEVNNTWSDALQLCKDKHMDSQLITIDCKEEWENLKNYIKENEMLQNQTWWLGATDENKEGAWKWATTNKPIGNLNWCRKEPNGGTHENCLHLMHPRNAPRNWCLNDLPCLNPGTWYPTNYICKV